LHTGSVFAAAAAWKLDMSPLRVFVGLETLTECLHLAEAILKKRIAGLGQRIEE